MKSLKSLISNHSILYHDLFVISGCCVLFIILISITDSVVSAFLFLLIITTCIFLLYFNSSRSRKKQVLLIFLIIGMFLTTAEFFALVYYKTYILNASDSPKYNYNRLSYWIEDEELGYGPVPSKDIRARKQVNDEIIYDVEYTIDEYGLRQNKKNITGRCTFLFFGGSEMFGEGLANVQTLPYQFSRKLNYNFNVLNFGFHGYGPHHMLRILELGLPNQYIKNRVPIIFYIMSSDDVLKISGFYEPFRRGPKYILKSEKLKYVGQLNSLSGIFNSWLDFKISIIDFLKNSQLFNLIPNMRNINSVILNRNVELSLKIIMEAKRLAKRTYNADLIVIGRKDESNKINELFLRLSDSNILSVDIVDLISRDWEEYYLIPGDDNYNEQANNEIATGLANRFGDC